MKEIYVRIYDHNDLVNMHLILFTSTCGIKDTSTNANILKIESQQGIETNQQNKTKSQSLKHEIRKAAKYQCQ